VSALSPLLESFFSERLIRQRRASPHTIAAYRDTFRLLLCFAMDKIGKAPSRLSLADLDGPLIGAFLDHLEHGRGNSVSTRNARLAAIKSFFSYAQLRCPEHAGLIARVLEIPQKRVVSEALTFLDRDEIEALLASPDQATRGGRRDHALLLLAVTTGLRVSEITGLSCCDVVTSGRHGHVRCIGKGRRERCTPLGRPLSRVLESWIKERKGSPEDPLFPGRLGGRLSRDAVNFLLAKHVSLASCSCPSLSRKTISPHVLRHTAAMNLLQAGVHRETIALWLGHQSLESTQVYMHASLTMKEEALMKTAPPGTKRRRYRPPDELLGFLEAL
jgi:integrase/recombinase XerD